MLENDPLLSRVYKRAVAGGRQGVLLIAESESQALSESPCLVGGTGSGSRAEA